MVLRAALSAAPRVTSLLQVRRPHDEHGGEHHDREQAPEKRPPVGVTEVSHLAREGRSSAPRPRSCARARLPRSHVPDASPKRPSSFIPDRGISRSCSILASVVPSAVPCSVLGASDTNVPHPGRRRRPSGCPSGTSKATPRCVSLSSRGPSGRERRRSWSSPADPSRRGPCPPFPRRRTRGRPPSACAMRGVGQARGDVALRFREGDRERGGSGGSARRVRRTARAPPPSPPSTPSGGRAQRERAPCSPVHATSPPPGPTAGAAASAERRGPVPMTMRSDGTAQRDDAGHRIREPLLFFFKRCANDDEPTAHSVYARSDTRRRPRESRFPSPEASATMSQHVGRPSFANNAAAAVLDFEGRGFRAHARGPGKRASASHRPACTRACPRAGR